MLKREDIEKREYEILSPYASKAGETRGRAEKEEKCSIRTEYQRDRDRIIHSKSFRRLMHKTQVFLSPEGDHFRTRLTHTIEVAQISKTVARSLALNEDLTEAIALGHDLGHTPFGHSGESILNEIHPGGFKHNEQSLRVVDVLETHAGKRGMNLTEEVRDGIVNHSGAGIPFTLEGRIVRICDRVAYINHDIDDALRSGVIKDDELPEDCIKVLGDTHSKRINRLVQSLIYESDGKNDIIMGEECLESMNRLREFMFKNVYLNKKVKKDEDLAEVDKIIRFLYDFYIAHPEELPKERYLMIEEYGVNEVVKDMVAGMTDRYATAMYNLFRDYQK